MKSLELARIALIILIVTTLLGIVQTVTFGDETVVTHDNRSPSATNLATGNTFAPDVRQGVGYQELDALETRIQTRPLRQSPARH